MTPALSVDAAMGRLSPMSEPTALSENPASDTTGSVVNAVTPSHPIADLGEKIEVLRVEAYILPKCDLPPPSELEPIETFVSNAIQSQHDENADPTFVQGYRAIADSLRRPEDPAMLRTIITALRTAGKGSTLYQMTSSQKHAMLTHLIFKFNSFDIPRKLKEADEQVLQPFRDYSMADAHFQLILALISAKSVNVVPAMTAVWKMLTFSRSEAPEPMRLRLHAMLSTMMRLCPKARTDLYSIIANNGPFWTKPREELDYYYKQCFTILEYLPNIRQQVIELVIDKALEIDVNIKIKDGGEVIIDDEKESDGIFDLDEDELEVEKKRKADLAVAEVNTLSDKLDCLLFLVFQHLYTQGTSDITVRELYREIMPTFESTILTTHKSKFVQYCFFLLCGLEAKAIDDGVNGLESQTHAILHRDFAAKLIEIVVNPYRATMTRQSGACYLASFISRATYVSPETVCESTAALLRWAEAYMHSLKINGVRAADAREQSELHSLFYTICQAAFYIMCFRGIDAVQFYRSAVDYHSSSAPTGEAEWDLPHPDHVDIGCKRWTLICGHELQPLRFCLESVRSEFLHVAHTFELIESQTLERLVVEAKRLSTGRVSKKGASGISTAATQEKKRQTGGVGGLGRGSNPLNSFFPFDPFLLRRSHDFIEPFYNYWQGPIQEDDMVEDDDEDDEAVDFAEDADDSDAEDDNSVDSSTQVQAMSYASNYTSCSDNPLLSTPETKKESLKQAWTDAMKRPRSLSVENGSW